MFMCQPPESCLHQDRSDKEVAAYHRNRHLHSLIEFMNMFIETSITHFNAIHIMLRSAAYTDVHLHVCKRAEHLHPLSPHLHRVCICEEQDSTVGQRRYDIDCVQGMGASEQLRTQRLALSADLR